MKKDDVGIIVLAAGPSTRLGQSKQMLKFKGRSLLQRAIDTANEVCGKNTVVVLGFESDRNLESISAEQCRIVINENWKAGMGSSLKAGLRYMLNEVPGIECAIIIVCDQPFLSSEHLSRLIREHKGSGKPIVASHYDSTNGVPALFHRTVFEAILRIEDNHGAKKLIDGQPHLVSKVDIPEGAFDIDSPEDLKHVGK